MPRSANTATTTSGSQRERSGSGDWKFCTTGITSHAISRSPAATATMPSTEMPNVHQ